jgi:hypothetical protein
MMIALFGSFVAGAVGLIMGVAFAAVDVLLALAVLRAFRPRAATVVTVLPNLSSVLIGVVFGAFNVAMFLLPFFFLPEFNEYGRDIGEKWSLIGIGILWPVVSYCTFRAWRQLGEPLNARVEPGTLATTAMLWGGIAGGVFFFAFLTVAIASNVAIGIREDSTQRLGDSFFSAIFYGSFGTGFAGGFGSIIGLVVGAIDVGVLRLAQRLSGRSP